MYKNRQGYSYHKKSPSILILGIPLVSCTPTDVCRDSTQRIPKAMQVVPSGFKLKLNLPQAGLKQVQANCRVN